MCVLGAVFISGTSTFLFPLGPFLEVTKALCKLSAASVSGIMGGEVTRGQANLKSGPGQGARGGWVLELWVFMRGALPSSLTPCSSSGEVQGMAETLSSFYFWQSYRRGVPLLCLF